MSILIKGIKMPKEGCKDCPLVKRGQVFDICPFLKRAVDGNVERGEKPYNCPLIELPDHGDLIDRDALKEDMDDKRDCETWIGIEECLKCADAAPVVIPAERSESNGI